MFSGNSIGEFIQRLEIGFFRIALNDYRRQYLHLEVRYHGCKLLPGCSPPAVGTDDRGEFSLGLNGIRQESRISNIGMGAGKHSRRADNNSSGIYQRNSQLADIRYSEVELLDGNTFTRQSLNEVGDHAAGAAVHGDVGYDNDVAGLIKSPHVIGINDELRFIVHGALAGSDNIYFIILNFIKVLLNLEAEGHHDFRPVAFGGFIFLPDIPHIHIRGSDMGTKKVAGEKNFIFPEVGQHSLRPVHPGGMDKLQSTVAQRNSLFIFDGLEPILGDQKAVDEHIFAPGGADSFSFRVLSQHLADAAGMVRLGVVEDNVVDTLDTELVEVIEQHILHRGVNSINEGGLFTALNQVGIIAGAIREGNKGVEQAPVPVNRDR